MGLCAAGGALAGTCNVPGTHATLQLALTQANCVLINIGAGDYSVSVNVDRSVRIVGAGAALTRLYAAQSGQSVLSVQAPAVLDLAALSLLVASDTPATAAISTANGAGLSLSEVVIGNATAPAGPLIFANGFE
jgi:hypothetical protein